jgi:hypothetical protein
MRYNILKSHLHPAFDKYSNRELAEGKNAYRVGMVEAVVMGFRGCALEQIK